jgi:lipoyl-dependent peroxiredoxin
MKRKAYAVWKGGIIDGSGIISSDSGVLSNTQYSFSSRFEYGVGTNPEELIAAAHAGCFSMAFPDSWEPQSSPLKASVRLQP